MEAQTYLRGVVEGERGLAFDVVVPSLSERVVRADDDLSALFSPIVRLPFRLAGLTCWLLPGSFVVASCSSLYFLNAGLTDCRILGSSTVRDLISAGGICGEL